ncbi:hypothetical protein [Rhizobium terrae]|uniref:hypothetical protein n=1 Tax=Rhizobium terrae TaxID=2171756 RepID=UPI000E3BC1A0|nr:hypothetical protein [Rhizobium terrae]
MRFETELLQIAKPRASHATYIHGSIFHLTIPDIGGRAKLICNGCQWLVVDESGTVVLHDEDAFSDAVIDRVFAGQTLHLLRAGPTLLTLRLDRSHFHAFTTEDYHLYLHDGVALRSVAWQKTPTAARASFMLFRPMQVPVTYEFEDYCDLSSEPWAEAYLEAQSAASTGCP